MISRCGLLTRVPLTKPGPPKVTDPFMVQRMSMASTAPVRAGGRSGSGLQPTGSRCRLVAASRARSWRPTRTGAPATVQRRSPGHVGSPVTSDIVAQCQTDERTVVGEQRPERFVTPKLPCRFVDQPTHRPPRPSPTNKLHGCVCLSAIVSARRTRASRTGASSSVGFVHGIIPAVGLCLCFRRCLCHGSGRRRPPAALVGPPDGLGLP